MTLPERIPTEIVPNCWPLPPRAWSCPAPCLTTAGTGSCCVPESRGATTLAASQEIEVLSGFRVQIEPVGPDELSLLLNRYYRREERLARYRGGRPT